ncbi:hypothetical protein GO491_07200 [Flavobacteriaceae bacterium Ap0902]|nr:hypothetical protein [Flavobacteriaceae bacterium Ap0902]
MKYFQSILMLCVTVLLISCNNKKDELENLYLEDSHYTAVVKDASALAKLDFYFLPNAVYKLNLKPQNNINL